ncbi:MAG: hypothetical protein HY231_11150 [Acidobacteria bacterium]|nr:hypothetical protein [Acidobacteriota bacterium]
MMENRYERPLFDAARVIEEEAGECTVEVSLSFAGRAIQKSAKGEASETGRLKAAAVATLEAVRQAVDHHFECSLADLDHVNALGKNLIAVLVDITFEGKDIQVFGSCPIVNTELDAAVKAALNATNRFVELSSRS